MDPGARIGLVSQVGEEIITPEELRHLFETNTHPLAYDGFEPSGQMHIAQGIMRAINTNKLLTAGVHFVFWVADWFAWMNNKMGGDLGKIRKVGEYQIEVWKACGMQTKNVEFRWASDVMGDKDYWKQTIAIARHNTLQRIIRCSQIMGRNEKDTLSAAQIFYPCMQASDVFTLKADITNLGMDQRKVNILAREVAPALGLPKPVVVSYHMLRGLTPPPTNVAGAPDRAIAMKMSKSKPESAIFMTDTGEEVSRKIQKAYCPAKQVEDNPLIEYMRYLIFERFREVVVERPKKFGGDITYPSLAELEADFRQGGLHPTDLKTATAHYINTLLSPVRLHFTRNRKARELDAFVRQQLITR